MRRARNGIIGWLNHKLPFKISLSLIIRLFLFSSILPPRSLTAQESLRETKKLHNPVAGILATYPKRVPRHIGDRVMAVFENPDNDGPEHRAVAEAMRHDVSYIEAMTTDETILRGSLFRRVIERRAKILPLVEKLLEIPEKEIDIWNVALTLAQDADPTLDAPKLNREFESILSRAGALAKARDDPDYHIRALNTFLFKKWGIQYDTSDYMGGNPINRHAHGVVATKKGTCANLATFYIALAQRIGFPIYAVSAPQHLFARYVDSRLLRQNIDPAGRGGFSSDEKYIADLEIPLVAVENGAFLRTMTHRELVAEMIADHATAYYAQELKDYPTAIMILDRALARSYRAVDYWYVMGQIYKNWGFEEATRDVREIKFTRALVFMQKAKRMGKGMPLEEGYWKKKQEKPNARGPEV